MLCFVGSVTNHWKETEMILSSEQVPYPDILEEFAEAQGNFCQDSILSIIPSNVYLIQNWLIDGEMRTCSHCYRVFEWSPSIGFRCPYPDCRKIT